MRGLAELLSEPQGSDALRERGVFVEFDDFVRALPPRPSLARLGSGAEAPGPRFPVWAGQQLYVDYRRSIVAKWAALERLRSHPGAEPLYFCVDTDRTGSEKSMASMAWRFHHGEKRLNVAAVRASRHHELRFVPSPRDLRADAFRKLRLDFEATFRPADLDVLEPRLAALEALFQRDDPLSLADFSYAVTTHLLDHLGFQFPAPRFSTVLDDPGMVSGVQRWLAHREGCIAAFNQAVAELCAEGIDPHVRPLPDDYLPLNYSCPEDQSRIRLSFQREGGVAYAVGRSQSGTTYRFEFHEPDWDFSALRETGRWSVDVAAPVFLNEVVSGVVVGKSSALYGLVLNRVLTQGLGLQPVPMLVAGDFAEPTGDRDSAIYDDLTADLRAQRAGGTA